MVSLSQESIEEIRNNLNSVADTINEQLDETIKDTEKEQEDREELIKENIVEKEKTDLTANEKKRFGVISKLFITEWIKSIESLQRKQEKRSALAIKKPKLLSRLNPFKKKEQDKPVVDKQAVAWWMKLLKILGTLGLIYALFKDHIKEFLPMIGEALSKLGGWLWDLAGMVLKGLWTLLANLCGELWKWIKEKLNLGAIGDWLAGVFEGFSNFIGSLWDGIKNGFKKFIDTILGLPKMLLGWIGEAFMWLLQPILDGLKAAWDFICDIFSNIFGWIGDTFSEWWDSIKAIWDGVVDFFSSIWDWITDIFSWEKVVNMFKSLWELVLKVIKGFFSFNLIVVLGKLVWKLIKGIFSFFSSDDDEDKKKDEKNENVPSIEAKNGDAREELNKQEDIKIKDNILDTIKDICDRLNVFFSAKKDSFIDLSKQAITHFQDGIKDIGKHLEKITVNNLFYVDDRDLYQDSYDYSDKSVNQVVTDNRKITNYDYSINYNMIDVPAVQRALRSIESQQREEILLLTSQNDYLNKMNISMVKLGDKLDWADPNKITEQTTNTIIPIMNSINQEKLNTYSPAVIKERQVSLARALR